MKNNLDMELIVCKRSNDLHEFIECWSGIYNDPLEHLYEEHIGALLTEESINALYHWKNGRKVAVPKQIEGIKNYYTPQPPAPSELEKEYLDHTKNGGAIWNIFYLHILSKNPHLKVPDEYPIFDQHTYRAMCFMKPDMTKETSMRSDKHKFLAYKKYKAFHDSIKIILGDENRKIDKAFFAFGQFLSKSLPYPNGLPD